MVSQYQSGFVQLLQQIASFTGKVFQASFLVRPDLGYLNFVVLSETVKEPLLRHLVIAKKIRMISRMSIAKSPWHANIATQPRVEWAGETVGGRWP